MTTKQNLTLATALLASASLGACGGSDSKTASTTTSTDAPVPAATAKVSNDVTVGAKEYAFDPTALEAKAGKFKVTLDNKGSIPHELVVLETDEAPDALKVDGSQRVSEKTAVGEVSEIDGGKTKTATLDLKPGKYVFVCNIPGHYGDGMRGALTVK